MTEKEIYEQKMPDGSGRTVEEYLKTATPPLDELIVEDKPAREFLAENPAKWYSVLVEGIYECLKRGLKLHSVNIYPIVRELDAKRNPKGW